MPMLGKKSKNKFISSYVWFLWFLKIFG
jgi:hypothetical protein